MHRRILVGETHHGDDMFEYVAVSRQRSFRIDVYAAQIEWHQSRAYDLIWLGMVEDHGSTRAELEAQINELIIKDQAKLKEAYDVKNR